MHKKTALFIGRFQPFHLGHLSDVKLALSENDFLIISIGSSNKSHTLENPFTVEERIEMIESVMKEEGIKNYKIIKDPDVGNDGEWMQNIKDNYPKFDVLYTGNPMVKKLFLLHGFKVIDVDFVEGISSTKIRELINKRDNKWKLLIPKSLIKKLQII